MPARDPRRCSRRTVLTSGTLGLLAVLGGCNGTTTPETSTTTATPTTETTEETTTSTTTSSFGDVASEFVTHLTAEEFEAAVALFSSGLRSSFDSQVPTRVPDPFSQPERALERYWRGLTSQHGAFNEVADLTARDSSETVIARLNCTLGSQQLRLQANSEGEITDLQFPAEYSPPDYAEPDGFEERSLRIQSDGPELGGTLTVPAGANEDVPCVVLVPGAGVLDRDGTLGPNKYLKDLAWGLASQGIAAYRYDKRTLGTNVPTAEQDIDTVFVNDAVAAAERVAEVDPIREDRVFVAGHSMGGWVTPRIADRHGGLAGVVLLDALALSVTEFGVRAKQAVKNTTWLTDRERKAYVRRYGTLAELSADEIDESPTIAGRPGALWKSLLTYDQVKTAAQLSIPLFISHTGRELGSSTPGVSRLSYSRWQDALPASSTRFAFYSDLNHYFQDGVEPFVPIELAFHDNVAKPTVDDIASWVGTVAS